MLQINEQNHRKEYKSVHLTQKTEIIRFLWRLYELYFNVIYRYKQRACFSCPENCLNHQQQSYRMAKLNVVTAFGCVCVCVRQ